MNFAALFLALIVATGNDAAPPTILDFHSQGCPPCRKMRPELDILATKGYPIRAIDVEKSPELAERYGVREVPTFIIIDDQGQALARTKGYQPAKQLADLYNQVRSQHVEVADDRADLAGADRNDGDELPDEDDREDGQPNPEPWKTIVRIQIDDPHTRRIGFGSGTIIDSNAEESLILTCAHLFHIEGQQKQYSPSKFPLTVIVELFDGVGQGPNKKVLPTGQKLKGKVIDYNFETDVALVKIRPGQRLQVSKVVPPTWKPKPGQKMTTVGCSQGHDPTAWTTKILNPAAPGPRPTYRGMECVHAPKQGRSGGGIFTPEGYVAGVCDFASFTNTGLYARPESIYDLLNRNNLTALYNPAAKQDTLVAGNRRARAGSGTGTVAGQQVAQTRGDAQEYRSITIPKPELLGVNPPGASVETVGLAWKATPVTQTRSSYKGAQPEADPQIQRIENVARKPQTRGAETAKRAAVVMQDPEPFPEDQDDVLPGPATGRPAGRALPRSEPAPAADANVGDWRPSRSRPREIPTIGPDGR